MCPVYATVDAVPQLPRYAADGKTFDQSQSVTFMQIQVFMTKWLPNAWDWLFDKLLLMMSKKAYPGQRAEWNLTPAPSIATTPPLIADAIYPFLESGFAEPVSAVEQIAGAKAVKLTNGRVLADIDTIIYTTGYESAITFAPEEYNPYPIADEAPALYRNIFSLHPDPDVRNSLAFLGQGGIPFPGFIQFELVIWAVSQIWQGKSHLPKLHEMQKWHRDHLSWRESIISKSKFNTKFYSVFLLLPDHLPWLDSTAGTGMFAHFSLFNWRSWPFWWQDRQFYKLCKNGLMSPAMWRLFDMGRRRPWVEAKQQILLDNEFAKMRQEERVRGVQKLEEAKKER